LHDTHSLPTATPPTPSAAARSFNPATGAWDGVGNMDVLAFETADSATAASKAWNKVRGGARAHAYRRRPQRRECVRAIGRDATALTTLPRTLLPAPPPPPPPPQNTQSWLGRYCNQRLPKSIGVWATYALSAFWHGAWRAVLRGAALTAGAVLC
jgi:hypothetical protein